MSKNISEIFDKISPSDEQKKIMLDNIMKTKNAPSEAKRKRHLSLYVKYVAGFAAALFICFFGKNFYDTHKETSDMYVMGNQSATSSETEISGTEEIDENLKNEETTEKNAPLRQQASDDLKTPAVTEEKSETETGENPPIAEEPKKEAFSGMLADDEIEKNTNEAVIKFAPVEETQVAEKAPSSSGGGSSAKKKEQALSENEIYQNEKFGAYVPKNVISGYTFSNATAYENKLSIYYNNGFYSVVVTINVLTDGSNYDRIVVEREDDSGKYYDVPVGNCIISYFVSDKGCDSETVKAMIYSAECFNKTAEN